MKIIIKKVNEDWSAQFDDGPEVTGTGHDAGTAMRQLVANCPDRNLDLDDFKPDFSASGPFTLVMVLSEPCPACEGTGKDSDTPHLHCSKCNGTGRS